MSPFLTFSELNRYSYFFPPLSVHSASMVFPSKKTSSEIRGEWSRLNEAYVIPLSHFIRQLLAPKLPLRNLNREGGKVLINELPKEDVEEAPEFDLIDSLNQLNLTFPSTFFLPQQYEGTPYFDTVLNKEGLESFMHYFTQATGIAGEIFVNADNFIADIPNLSEKFTHSMACLVSFESTKRHMTGIYLKKENEKITAYIFDTTGLSLPGYPCGYRGYSDNKQLEIALRELSANDITPAIMPVNTVVSIQNDQFSCLMATVLFFIGMQKNAYQLLKEPGITDSYGDSYFYKNSDNSITARGVFTGSIKVQMYVTTFLPLLIGAQNRLAFLFMMDPISNIDNSFSDIISIRANWMKKQTNVYGTCFYNYFWQFTYVELLGWFNNCFHQKQAQPLPDFERIMHQRTEYFAGRSLNPFEIRVGEIKRAEPAVETHLNQANKYGPAFIAAQNGHVEVIKLKADLNKARNDGASVDMPFNQLALRTNQNSEMVEIQLEQIQRLKPNLSMNEIITSINANPGILKLASYLAHGSFKHEKLHGSALSWLNGLDYDIKYIESVARNLLEHWLENTPLQQGSVSYFANKNFLEISKIYAENDKLISSNVLNLGPR